MSISRQFGTANLGGDPKLKLPLVAAVPQTPSRKETAAKSVIAQFAGKGSSSPRARKRRASAKK